MHERLGLNSDLSPPKSAKSETSGEIQIKTLTQIRQEKVAKSKIERRGARVVTEVSGKTTSSPPSRGNKPVVGSQMRTSQILHGEKALTQEDAEKKRRKSSKKTESTPNLGVEKAPTQEREVRVKTLEEIRRAKAARMQAQNQAETQNSSSDLAAKKRILCIGKNTCKCNSLLFLISDCDSFAFKGLTRLGKKTIDVNLIINCFLSATNSSSQKEPQDLGTKVETEVVRSLIFLSIV